ncbi:uncharacterized protein LOC142173782 [Nicotiana tabacum]|uniref:Uncharacterized protein LOC142173782 n=1 Tax=Nicotiana tabacum TaxID=4097 RepID=A0AC58TE83_TOBAC
MVYLIPLQVIEMLSFSVPSGKSCSHCKEFNSSSAYHPQSDGHTEVLNRSLETYVRCYNNEDAANWYSCLPMAEYWYNTSFHSAIHITPYEALYGRPPPLHLPYLPGESASAEVDNTLLNRELKLQLLKHHTRRAQHRMKQQADSHRSDRQFDVGDWVYMKIQLYKQIHPILHVSLIKRCYEVPSQIFYPPVIDLASPYCPNPELILQRRMAKKGNKAVAQVLVKWQGLPADAATWEFVTVLQTRFCAFNLCGQGSSIGGEGEGGSIDTQI